MNAYRFRVNEHGPAGSVVREGFEPQDPKPGWVRLQLKAMALNHLDLWTTVGLKGYPLPLPLTPGAMAQASWRPWGKARFCRQAWN
ncbi:MAG: hypothetical protein IPP78_14240 [Holophagaceae bacterium]|nr:hypothetical protein [Holophagaceae bacterium]